MEKAAEMPRKNQKTSATLGKVQNLRTGQSQYSKQVNLQLQLQFSYPRKRQFLPATVVIIIISYDVL